MNLEVSDVPELPELPGLIAFIPFYIDSNDNIRRTFHPKKGDECDAGDSGDSKEEVVSKNVIPGFLLNMPVKDFNSYKKENRITDNEIKKLIYERRKHKNRGYSKASRLRKKEKNSSFAL